MATPVGMRLLVLVPVASLLLLLAGCGGAEVRKANHFARGQDYLAAGTYEKARIEFRNALQIAPADSEVRYENGVVEEKLGRPQAAVSFYQGALDSNADNVSARAALGRLLLLGGQASSALDTVQAGLAKHPDDAELLTIRAGARIQMKDPAAARVDAERAVQLAPDNEDAIQVLAGIERADQHPERSESLLREAVKRIPGTVELRLVLAQLEASLGNNAETEALLLELVRIRPQDKAHRLRLAQFYARLDRSDEAEKVLRDGIKALPEERAMKLALVEFLAARRSLDVAEAELKGFIAADPKDYELRFDLAQFYLKDKDASKAEAVYQQVIDESKLEAPGLTARVRYAALLIQQNDIKGAGKLIGEVLAQSPRDDDALILRGNLALAQKDPKSAIADLRSVLRDQPNSLGVMRTLARAHFANGEPALAEETMRRAVDGNPADAQARLDLAQLLSELGKPEQARPVIDELVRRQPNNLPALETQFKITLATRDLVTARAAADALVATDPKSSLGYYYQGLVADASKHPEDALRFYDVALQLDSQGAEPLQAAMRDLVMLKRTPEALRRLDALIAGNPQAAFPATIKGDVLMSEKRPQDAAAAFRLAISIDPGNWVPYRNLALARFASKDNDAALATLKDGIGRAKNPEALQADLARVFEQLGRVDEAVAVYDAALARNPQSDLAANNLAMLLVTYRKDKPSLDRARALVAHFANFTDLNFLDTYGWVMYKYGDAAVAVGALRDVLAKAPKSPLSMYHLGMAQALAGQNDAARDNLAHSLQAGQKFAGMDEAQATLDRLGAPAPAVAAAPKS